MRVCVLRHVLVLMITTYCQVDDRPTVFVLSSFWRLNFQGHESKLGRLGFIKGLVIWNSMRSSLFSPLLPPPPCPVRPFSLFFHSCPTLHPLFVSSFFTSLLVLVLSSCFDTSSIVLLPCASLVFRSPSSLPESQQSVHAPPFCFKYSVSLSSVEGHKSRIWTKENSLHRGCSKYVHLDVITPITPLTSSKSLVNRFVLMIFSVGFYWGSLTAPPSH